MSVAGPIRPPRICSGAMYIGVPSCPVAVVAEPWKIFAMPKSVTFTVLAASNMTLSSLMSRCSTPRPCAYPSADATPRPTAHAASGPIPRARRVSVPPASISITIRHRSSAST